MSVYEPSIQVDQALTQQQLISERLRATILVSILAFVLLFRGIELLFRLPVHSDLYDATWQTPAVTICLAAAIGYELLLRWLLGRYLAARRQPPRFRRYVTAMVEIAIPTVVLAIQAYNVDVYYLHGLPPTYAYASFIVLSALHLSFWLSAFTGALAALGFLTVAWLVIEPRLPPAGGREVAMALALQSANAALILLTGIVTGLIALQIRKQIVNSLRSLESRQHVLDTFGQHVSPEVVDHLMNTAVALGGESRHVCVMFLDIRNFTAFAEQRKPAEVLRYLNELFAFMIDSVNRHRGIVNKFLGDGFMAVFGAPLSDGRDSLNAVAAACDILDRLERLNQGPGAIPTRIGMGLHSGDAVAGIVGSAQRKEYTIIGDTVNVAARIEQLNKQFDSRLLVSEAVWQEIGGNVPEAVCLGSVPVKGKEEPIQVYKLA
jgi:adenylate cyclase